MQLQLRTLPAVLISTAVFMLAGCVAGSLDGEVVARNETEVDGNPAVDVEMTFGEGYIVFFQLVTGEEHIVQALASGPEVERAAVRRTYRQLSDSVAY